MALGEAGAGIEYHIIGERVLCRDRRIVLAAEGAPVDRHGKSKWQSQTDRLTPRHHRP
jgi:hypothetical protein